jgi:hypothetical protein
MTRIHYIKYFCASFNSSNCAFTVLNIEFSGQPFEEFVEKEMSQNITLIFQISPIEEVKREPRQKYHF